MTDDGDEDGTTIDDLVRDPEFDSLLWRVRARYSLSTVHATAEFLIRRRLRQSVRRVSAQPVTTPRGR